MRCRQTKKGHTAVTFKAYINTLNVLCPLLCDAPGTLRPLRVDILFLKPCSFFLWRLLRLIGSQHIKNPSFREVTLRNPNIAVGYS